MIELFGKAELVKKIDMEQYFTKLTNRKEAGITYRECFGYSKPPPGIKVKIRFMQGCKFMVIWEDCPDLENVIELFFNTYNEAREYVLKHGWCLDLKERSKK